MKGATAAINDKALRYVNFNSRSREGSDLKTHSVWRVSYISIHAPVKGATCVVVIFTRVFAYFNSRSREGSDV